MRNRQNHKAPTLRDLKRTWEQKLKDSGFEDIESPKGHLKQYDRRTIAFDNRELILSFFIKLDHYLESPHSKKMPREHRRIMQLYSSGVFLKEISKHLKCGRTKVQSIIKKYKALVISIEEPDKTETVEL